MTETGTPESGAARTHPNPLSRAVALHRPLMVFGVVMAVTAVVSVGGLLFDDRVLGGAPIWLKPFKFAVSFALYSITWAWMISLQHRYQRASSRLATVVVALAAVEMVIMVGQVIRGRASHFNSETAFDTTLFLVMGGSIAVVWVLNLVMAVFLLRERLADRANRWAIRLGALLSLAGMALGVLMLGPTDDQLARAEAGEDLSMIGAHSVGVADGGPAMPVTGWSTTGGDLRIPHFVGLHGMQVLPLLAAGLVLLAARFPLLRQDAVRLRLVLVGAAGYGGLVALVTWQALRAQPLLRPDGWTLGVFGVLVVAVVLGAAIAVTRGRRRGTDVPAGDDASVGSPG